MSGLLFIFVCAKITPPIMKGECLHFFGRNSVHIPNSDKLIENIFTYK